MSDSDSIPGLVSDSDSDNDFISKNPKNVMKKKKSPVATKPSIASTNMKSSTNNYSIDDLPELISDGSNSSSDDSDQIPFNRKTNNKNGFNESFKKNLQAKSNKSSNNNNMNETNKKVNIPISASNRVKPIENVIKSGDTSNNTYRKGTWVECYNSNDHTWKEGIIIDEEYITNPISYRILIIDVCKCPGICNCSINKNKVTDKYMLIPHTSSNFIKIKPEIKYNYDVQSQINTIHLSKYNIQELQKTLKKYLKSNIQKKYLLKALSTHWEGYIDYVLLTKKIDFDNIHENIHTKNIEIDANLFANFILNYSENEENYNIYAKKSDKERLESIEYKDADIIMLQIGLCSIKNKIYSNNILNLNEKEKEIIINDKYKKSPLHPVVNIIKAIHDYKYLITEYKVKHIESITDKDRLIRYQNIWKCLETAALSDYISLFTLERILEFIEINKNQLKLLPIMKIIYERYLRSYEKYHTNITNNENLLTSMKQIDLSTEENNNLVINIEKLENEKKEIFINKWQSVLDLMNNLDNIKKFSWLQVKKDFDQIVDLSQQLHTNKLTWTSDDYDDDEESEEYDHNNDSMKESSSIEVISNILTSPSSSSLLDNIEVIPDVDENDLLHLPIQIEISQDVKKWFEREKLMNIREKFRDTLDLLAKGYRSYAKSKRLKGCRVPIFESKLLKGPRILWTYILRDVDVNNTDTMVSSNTCMNRSAIILVWYVVMKHDDVSHFLKLIETGMFRTCKQLVGDEVLQEESYYQADLVVIPEQAVLVDPMKNVPMRIYVAPKEELSQICEADWKASLRFNKREQKVRTHRGTVLLLGRSGTGKTLCLIDRIDHDRRELRYTWDYSNQPHKINQLFIARSRFLCELVQKEVESSFGNEKSTDINDITYMNSMRYMRMRDFLTDLEQAIQRPSGEVLGLKSYPKFLSTHPEDKYIDYHKFRTELFPKLMKNHKSELDVLIVWTQIRSFIKGSLESLIEKELPYLSKEQYKNEELFPIARCRLNSTQRDEAYRIFLRYQEYLDSTNNWDDMDRTRHIYKLALNTYDIFDMPVFYEKLYVDEVQDYTQAEIELFIIAVGIKGGNIFFAGDPAQAVVEGVEFRFEEVRSSAHHHDFWFEKPMILKVNYRSHAGILKCAASIIKKLIDMFPGSAKTLSIDKGLFQGPRPIYFNPISNGKESLLNLLSNNKRITVICHDDQLKNIKEYLNWQSSDSNFMIGIRQSKGLEFDDVLLLNFFSDMPNEDRIAWKFLFENDNPNELAENPYNSLLPYLKMLYTAVTRAINRLIFVELKQSDIGNYFFRWLDRKDLAEKLNPEKIKIDTKAINDKDILYSSTEFKARGIQIVIGSEMISNMLDQSDLLKQAALDFKHAESYDLAHIAKVQANLCECLYKIRNFSIESESIWNISNDNNNTATTNHNNVKDNTNLIINKNKSEINGKLNEQQELYMIQCITDGLKEGLFENTKDVCEALPAILSESSINYFENYILKKLSNMKY